MVGSSAIQEILIKDWKVGNRMIHIQFSTFKTPSILWAIDNRVRKSAIRVRICTYFDLKIT